MPQATPPAVSFKYSVPLLPALCVSVCEVAMLHICVVANDWLAAHSPILAEGCVGPGLLPTLHKIFSLVSGIVTCTLFRALLALVPHVILA